MISFQNFHKHWDHFWFRDAPPHVLAIFRIALGSFFLLYFGLMWPHVAVYFSRAGLLMPFFEPDTPFGFGLLFVPPSPAIALLLFSVFFVSLICFTIGLFTRAATVLTFLFYVYYWNISLFQFATSFDRLFLFTMLVLCFGSLGKAFSVDMRMRHGSWFAYENISILPQRLIAMQITFTYLGVGWQKFGLPAWQSGTVLAYGFMGRWATPPAWYIARLNLPLWLYDFQVYLIKIFEGTIPFGLWSRRYRKWFFLAGALFHIGIAVLLAIWWFLPLIPAYILFIAPEELFTSLNTKLHGKLYLASRQ